jgi:cytochrome c biogenesis protein
LSASDSPPTLLASLWELLTSIRFTIFLLLALALESIIGTLRYQGIYYTPWFLAPVMALTLNLLACLVKGLPRAMRRVLQPFTGEQALALPERGRFAWPAGADPRPMVAAALRQELGRPRQGQLDGREIYLYERGRLRPLGPYVVHLALLLILLGALIGKYWGVEGSLMLLRGETATDFQNIQTGKPQPLGFQVRLDNFQVQYYQDGRTPREFRSDLTLLRPGEKPETAVCRVNDPVTFGRFTLYQASYGRSILLQVKNGENTQVLEAPVGRTMQIPGRESRVKVLEVEENLQMPMQTEMRALGPAAKIAYLGGSGHAQVIWVLKNYPQMVERQPGPDRFTLLNLSPDYFSVFQVKRDPGVWWVYSGFILLLPGFFLAFCRLPQRWAVVLQQGKKGQWEGRLLGAGPRARESFAAHQERLLARLDPGANP